MGNGEKRVIALDDPARQDHQDEEEGCRDTPLRWPHGPGETPDQTEERRAEEHHETALAKVPFPDLAEPGYERREDGGKRISPDRTTRLTEVVGHRGASRSGVTDGRVTIYARCASNGGGVRIGW